MKEIFKNLVPSALVIMAVVVALNSGLPAAEAVDANHTPEKTSSDDRPKKKTPQKKKKAGGKEKAANYSASSTDLSQCADGTFIGTGNGFAGIIKVEVAIKDHKMTSISLVEAEADDPPYVAKAKGVINSIMKSQSLDVDAVTGATFSSNGIIMAVEDALSQAAGKGSKTVPKAKKKKPEKMKPDPDMDNQTYKDGSYIGTGTGFNGKITVNVIIKSGKMSSIKITKNQGDDLAYLQKAKAVINRILKTQSVNVDAVSGATYSSNGIIEAVRNALKKAVVKKPDKEKETKPPKETQPPKETKPPEENTEPGNYVDGTYTGSSRGYQGFITVSVVVSEGKITRITITDSKDDEPFITNAKAVITKIIKNQSADGIDAVSGATYSSVGIIEAVQKALVKAAKDEE